MHSCSSIPKGQFTSKLEKENPDYSDLKNWASSPFKEDGADKTPGNLFENNQESAKADVFFLHPTSYTKQRGNTNWNGALDDEKLNDKTNRSIQYQASVFNGACRVFAPLYRQAHIHVFYNEKEEQKSSAEKALYLAYKDIKIAFQYYLDNHNDGRPIIIAGHSQGTIHAANLIKDFFEGKTLNKQLVAAYLIGMPIRDKTFTSLLPCESAEDTNCFVTWRSYQRGYLPKWHEPNSNIIVTNPLTWKTDNKYASKELNKGTLLFNFDDGTFPGLADAQVYEDHLWINKPKFKNSIFITFKNYHIADYNLFYVNIRENVKQRLESYLKETDK